MTKKLFIGTMLFCLASFFISCNTLKELAKNEISKQVINLQKCEFKLDKIVDFKLAGLDISKINSIKDISLLDAAKLVQTFNNKKVPINFTLNVAALNPNDGTNGTTKSAVTLQKLDWSLLIDGVNTLSGAVNKAIEIPNSADEKTIIPLDIGLDLYEFFGNKGYESLINVALGLGGLGGSASKLTLNGKPTISTPFGPIEYPNEIQIVEKEFRAN
jgi:hypothetical protein